MPANWKFNIDAGASLSKVRDGAVRGLFLAAEHILYESNKQVPIEEGTLERSGRTSVDGDSLRAAVSYDTPYAVVQHEDMTLHHDAGRNAKFLENAMNSEVQVARSIIAAQIRKALGT